MPHGGSLRVATRRQRFESVDCDTVTGYHLVAGDYETLTAVDGLAAVECFERERTTIDLVLLDAVMPGLGGAEAFRRIRVLEPGVPVVLVSGYARNATIDQLLSEDLDGFLMKPYTRDQLTCTIESAMQRKRDRFETNPIDYALRIAETAQPPKSDKHV